MAVVLEYQAWDSSSWLWTDNVTSTAPTQQIMAKLNTFVAASNANPGNAARQITVTRTPSSSTTANYFGFGVQCASPTSGATVHCRLYSSAATNIRSEFSSGFTNDTSNGGYGTATGSIAQDTSVAWFNSGQTGELICAYDTEDGKEFFALGWRLANAAATSDMWMFFKDNNNEWAAMFSDGGTVNCTFWDSVCSTPFRSVGATLNAGQSTAGVLEPLALAAGGTTGLVAGSSFRQRIVAANPSLFITNLSSNFGFGKWANVTAGGKVVCLGNGPLWIKTP